MVREGVRRDLPYRGADTPEQGRRHHLRIPGMGLCRSYGRHRSRGHQSNGSPASLLPARLPIPGLSYLLVGHTLLWEVQEKALKPGSDPPNMQAGEEAGRAP
jgi:hypothetical protein